MQQKSATLAQGGVNARTKRRIFRSCVHLKVFLDNSYAALVPTTICLVGGVNATKGRYARTGGVNARTRRCIFEHGVLGSREGFFFFFWGVPTRWGGFETQKMAKKRSLVMCFRQNRGRPRFVRCFRFIF